MLNAHKILIANGLAETVWGKRIIKAEDFGSFSALDAVNAGDWVTCACGENDKEFSRETNGRPRDAALYRLGHVFNDDVQWDNYTAAAKTLGRIDRRATHIIATERKYDE